MACRFLSRSTWRESPAWSTADDISPGHAEYERNRVLLTAEASAAVRGVYAYDADARVLVTEAHAAFRNLLPERLDRRAELLRGAPKPWGMMSGLDKDIDAVVFIGYHGKAGTPRSVMAHTISGGVIADVRCNGRSLGELGLNTALAAHSGVPPVLVAGDDSVAAEAADVAPGMRSVVVKRALGARAAALLHPDEACDRIEQEVPEGSRGPRVRPAAAVRRPGRAGGRGAQDPHGRARAAGTGDGTRGRPHPPLHGAGLPDRLPGQRAHRAARRPLTLRWPDD